MCGTGMASPAIQIFLSCRVSRTGDFGSPCASSCPLVTENYCPGLVTCVPEPPVPPNHAHASSPDVQIYFFRLPVKLYRFVSLLDSIEKKILVMIKDSRGWLAKLHRGISWRDCSR
uniref:Uncharacterized protein n=1 Tax=Zea mays TaxID=4577 RepID=C4IYL7_MAIZE|nr:unknown [Zea mays]